MNTLRDYIDAVLQRKVLVAVCALLGLLVAVLVGLLRPPTYSSTLALYVSAQQDNTVTAAYQGNLLSQERTKSYVELLQSDRIYSSVVQELRLQMTPNELRDSVSATNDTDSVIIGLSASNEDPQVAAAIANGVAANFISLVDELERPTAPGQIQPTIVRVVQPAVPPGEPSSLGVPVLGALGLAVGLFVGIAGAIVWNLLDTAVRTSSQLRDLLDKPVLGVISRNKSGSESESIDFDDLPLEALRQLRTNLQFVRVTKNVQSIVISSSRPSEGKTTTVLCLAQVLGQSGHRVVVVDADLRRPRVAAALGIEQEVGLTSILSSRLGLRGAVQSFGAFDVIASGSIPPNPSELLGSELMRKVLQDLSATYDTILIDTPPCLAVTDPVALSAIADGVLLVCRHGSTKTDEIRRAMELMKDVEAPVLGTVLNMVPRSSSYNYSGYYYAKHEGVESSNKGPTIGVSGPAGGRMPVPFKRNS